MNTRGSSGSHFGSAFVPVMGIGNHMPHPWIEARQIEQPQERKISATVPSYVTQIDLLFGPCTQHRAVGSNYESRVCGQRTAAGGIMDRHSGLTIPIELLDEQLILELPAEGLKELVFLKPHSSFAQSFIAAKNVFITRAMRLLRSIHSLEKITFPLDLLPLTETLGILANIPGMEEIVLSPPIISELQPTTMLGIQEAFAHGLRRFRNLKRLTVPMGFVTPFLLSYLSQLPDLRSLTVNSSSHLPRHHSPFPPWSSYREPSARPGFIFLNRLNFDPRGLFQQLSRLELGIPISDSTYSILKNLFPRAIVC